MGRAAAAGLLVLDQAANKRPSTSLDEAEASSGGVQSTAWQFWDEHKTEAYSSAT